MAPATTLAFLFVYLAICSSTDLHYKEKLVGAYGNFGFSLATAPNKLVIGSPIDQLDTAEPVMVVTGDSRNMILPPQAHKMEWFGQNVAINEQYILVVGKKNYQSRLFIYQAKPQYTLVAEIPTDKPWEYIDAAGIGPDNTIVIVMYDSATDIPATVVNFYQYDGFGVWSRANQWRVVESPEAHALASVDITMETVVVGFSYMSHNGGGVVEVFQRRSPGQKSRGTWFEHAQTLKPPHAQLYWFGCSVAMDDQHLVVSSMHKGTGNHHKGSVNEVQHVLVYRRQPISSCWILDGTIDIPTCAKVGDDRLIYGVATQNGTIAAVVITDNTKDTVTTKIFRKGLSGGGGWEEQGTLIADQIDENQYNFRVRMDSKFVYTSRYSPRGSPGVVFVHDLSQL